MVIDLYVFQLVVLSFHLLTIAPLLVDFLAVEVSNHFLDVAGSVLA